MLSVRSMWEEERHGGHREDPGILTKAGISFPSVFSPLVIAAAVMIRSSVMAICVLYPKKDVSAVLCPVFYKLS